MPSWSKKARKTLLAQMEREAAEGPTFRTVNGEKQLFICSGSNSHGRIGFWIDAAGQAVNKEPELIPWKDNAGQS